MKKIICIFMALLMLSGCKPVETESQIENIQVEQTVTNEQKTYEIKTAIPYIQSEILVEAKVDCPEKIYSYEIIGSLQPQEDAFYEVFPQLKGKIQIKTDENGRIVPPFKYSGEGEEHVICNGDYAEIVFRQEFQSEEKIDNEYESDEVMTFNAPYDETEKLVLDTAKKLFGGTFKVTELKRFGKYTGENYYVFFLNQSFDGITFSQFGRKTQTGKDEEGYAQYKTLSGGNKITVFVDKEGIAQISWRMHEVKLLKEEQLLNFEELFSKLQSEITAYSMNNYADFKSSGGKVYDVKPYKITDIKLIWAIDNLSENKTGYVPCFKLTSYNEKGTERYTIINAVNGEILTTRF